MAETISCPQCRRSLRVAEEYQGRQVRCPACQGIFVFGPTTNITIQAPPPVRPESSSDVQPGPPAEDEPESWQPRRRRRSTWDDDDLAERVIFRGEFKPAGALGVALKVLLALNILIGVVMIGSDYLQYQLAARLQAGINVQDAELNSNDARQMALGLAHFGTYIATVVVFVIWFYRAHRNLERLGARDLTYTSGWAAGCWFVPFLNLVRPVQIAQEIWRHSDPNVLPREDALFRPSGNSTLIGFWWAMWIISNVINNIAVRLNWAVNSPETLRSASAVGMIAEVGTIIAALFALAVVFAIDARQTARAEALQA
jgi:hypothetical protein